VETSAVNKDQDPVEILWDMAQRGDIDPWDVDIIDATDRFLSILNCLDARGLTKSARCIFYAAALVHMKARALAEGAALWGNEEYEDEEDWEEEGSARLRPTERPLYYPRRDARLTPRDRKPRGRSLTLNDLIDALRRLDAGAMLQPEEDDDYDEDEFQVFDFDFDEELGEIETAHEDDLEGDLLVLRESMRAGLKGEVTEVNLSDLPTDMHPGSAFRALLFLYRDGELDFEQEEFYGEISISQGPEPLKELSEEDQSKLVERQARSAKKREPKERRPIPRPGRKGRKPRRRPGLAPAAHSRRPRNGRRRSARALDDMIRSEAPVEAGGLLTRPPEPSGGL